MTQLRILLLFICLLSLSPLLLATESQQFYIELEQLHSEGRLAFEEASDYPLARQKFQKGLELALNNDEWSGIFHTALGIVYQEWGKFQQAQEHFQTALDIDFETANQIGTLDTIKKVIADFNNLGVVYDNLGERQRALIAYQSVLEIRRQLGDQEGESQVLTNLGVFYLNQGNYQSALEYFSTAMTIQTRLATQSFEPDKRKEYQRQIAENFSNLGISYQSLGDDLLALKYLEQALSLQRELQNKSGEGTVLNNLGNVYNLRQDYQSASCHYQAALEIQRDLEKQQDQAITLANLGDISRKQQDYDKALEYFQQAQSIYQQKPNKRGESAVIVNLGEIYYLKSQEQDQQLLKTAYQTFQRGYQSLQEIRGEDRWRAQSGLANIEVLWKQFPDAIQHYQEALDNLEELRTGIKSDNFRQSFMADDEKLQVYDNYMALLSQRVQHHQKQRDSQATTQMQREAFELFERKQGRMFLEEMGKSVAGSLGRYLLPSELWTKEAQLAKSLSQVTQQLTNELAKGEPDIEHLHVLQTQHIELVKQETELQQQIAIDHPNYSALKYPKPVALDTLQQQVLQKNEAILIYHVRKKATDVWLIGPGHFEMFSLPLTANTLKEQVDKFRETGVDSAKTTDSSKLSESLKNAQKKFINASATLYQTLFPPEIRQRLASVSPQILYIVPTEALYQLPFEALVTDHSEDKPHYLIQDHAVSYLSSASLLKTLREARNIRLKTTSQTSRQPVLVFTNPDYPLCPEPKGETTGEIIMPTQLRRQIYLKGMNMPDGQECFGKLAGTEGEDILKVFGVFEPQPSPFLQKDTEASKTNLLKFNDNDAKPGLDDFQYILFSTHAVVPDPVTPLNQPALILSHKRTTDDGFLTMTDVFGLTMNADLVVLSACNTGRGEAVKGEGVRGLTRAFMYAGTSAVVVTLWSVETQSTEQLSIQLFQELKSTKGELLAKSLQNAKIAMLNDPIHFYPYFWAGVVIFGEGQLGN